MYATTDLGWPLHLGWPLPTCEVLRQSALLARPLKQQVFISIFLISLLLFLLVLVLEIIIFNVSIVSFYYYYHIHIHIYNYIYILRIHPSFPQLLFKIAFPERPFYFGQEWPFSTIPGSPADQKFGLKWFSLQIRLIQKSRLSWKFSPEVALLNFHQNIQQHINTYYIYDKNK